MRTYLFSNILKLAPVALIWVSAFGQYQGDDQQEPQPYPSQNYAQSYQQDPNDVPGQAVARLSWMAGDVSVRRGDSGQPVAAAINAPLLVEDYVTTAPGARAELELDYAQRARLGPDAEMRLATLEANRYQLQLSRGFLSYSVLRNPPAQVEISTPSVSVRPVGRGSFRVWVREDGETTITVRSGSVEVFTPRGTEQLRRGQSMLVRGNPQDPEYQIIASQGNDEFDTWCDRRDRDMERSVSYRYVSQDIVGAEDLDAYGRWDNDPQYGEVWVPQVAADWSPYRDGRWSWEDYYGWTWVGAEPWGWAPYHYGNWYHASFGWAWYPGQYRERHFWRPAVVGFFGFGNGGGFDLSAGLGKVGWCPLAPFETYHPWYGGSYGGRYGGGYGGYGNTQITNVNMVNNTNITNVYRNAIYGATAVNAGQFLNGGNRYMRVPGAQLQNAALVRGQLPLTPTANNLMFANRQTAAIPRTNFETSRFYSRNPGMQQNNVRVPFQQQQQMVRQSQQVFARQAASPGVRFGNQVTAGQNNLNQRTPQQFGTQPGMQNGQQFGRSGYVNNNMNQRTPQQFGAQPGMQNGQQFGRSGNVNNNMDQRPNAPGGQQFGRPGFSNNNMNQRTPQQFGAQPGMQNGQQFGRPGYPNNNMNQRPNAPTGQQFGRPGYSNNNKSQRNAQQFGAQPNVQAGQQFGRPGYGNLSQRAPQQFGGQSMAPAAPYAAPRDPRGQWSRFGQPNGAGNPQSPRAANPGTGWSTHNNRGVPFGENPQNATRPQYNSPAFNRTPQNYGHSQRSLQLSQPMLQPRAAAPAYSAPSRPAYSAPAYRPEPSARPSYNAPAYRLAPAYQAPMAQRQQMYSAPAYRQAPAYREAPRQQQLSAPAFRPQPQQAPREQFSAPAFRPQPQQAPRQQFSAPAFRPQPQQAPRQQFSAPPQRSQPSYQAPEPRANNGNQEHRHH